MAQTPRKPQPRHEEAESIKGDLILCLIAAAFAGILLFGFTWTCTLVCTRISDHRVDVLVHETCFVFIPLPDRRVENVLRADMREHVSLKGSSSYGVDLYTPSRTVDIVLRGPENRVEATAISQQINAFVANPTSTPLTVQARSASWFALLPLAFIVFALAKTAQSIYWKRRLSRRPEVL